MSNVRNFGATGDGRTDDTAAILHAIKDGDGTLEFPRGDYLITRTIEVPLEKVGRTAVVGSGGVAKLVMKGPGPALRIIGTHAGTADPASFKPTVWRAQRSPTLLNIEIEGGHAEADGVELIGTMQALLEGVGLHRLRHGVMLSKRNRNVLISHCQIYHNTGVGVLLDGVNLHQINIIGNHISYCRLGGIRIQRSQIRNLQITGNDIEYNNNRSHRIKDEPTAEIYIDTTAEGASVNEVTIGSNTIQATPSPGGANIRILDKPGRDRPPGLYAISGNIIGSQTNNVHLTGCYGVSLSGNAIYSCVRRNLLLENCRQITIGSNHFRRHTPALGTGVRLVDSTDCVLSGCQMLDEAAEGQRSGASLLELTGCRRITVAGCQMTGGVPYGIDVADCSDVSITGCTITEAREKPKATAMLRWHGRGSGNLLASNRIGRGTEGATVIDARSGVVARGNLIDEKS